MSARPAPRPPRPHHLLRSPLTLLLLLVTLARTPLGRAADVPEAEPNNTKSAATLIALACGDRLIGSTTGAASTPGPASADYFLIRTLSNGALRRYRLLLTTPTPGHTLQIRGLTQSDGLPSPGSDATLQTAAAASPRFLQWYGTGPAGSAQDIVVRIAGTAETTAPYTLTLECADVATIPLTPASIPAGPITIEPGPTNTTDIDLWVYDAALHPIPGFGRDEPQRPGLLRNFVPGSYTIAVSNFNTANNLPSPPDDDWRFGTVLDFPNVLVNTNSTLVPDLSLDARSAAGPSASGFASKSGPFDIAFYGLDVLNPPSPTPPLCTVSASPALIRNDGLGSVTLTVEISPGAAPPSTAHTVHADLSAIGGGGAVPLAEGPPNIFTLTTTVPADAPLGPVVITLSIIETAPLARTSDCAVILEIAPPPTGACCVASSCQPLTQADCALLGGVYIGDFAPCTPCVCAGTPPQNDRCTDAISLAIPAVVLGSTCAAAPDSSIAGDFCGASITAPGVWYRLVGTGRNLRVSTCSPLTDFDTKLSVFCAGGCAPDPTCISGSDDSCSNPTLASTVSFCTQLGAEYLILVHGFNTAAGRFQLSVVDEGTPCTPSVSCTPVGACCTPSGCSVTTQSDCTTAGGRWLGPGAACAPLAITYERTFASPAGAVIPDFSNGLPGILADTISIPDPFLFTDVSVAVDIPDHTFLGDLEITLTRAGITIPLVNRRCAANDGFEAILSDHGEAVICSSPTRGEFLPESPLAPLAAANAAGTWTLTVADRAEFDTGTLKRWELRFNRTATTRSACACHGLCFADFDDGSATGTPDGGVGVEDLLFFLGIYDLGSACADLDDGSATGTPDAGVGIEDLLFFLTRYDTGC